MRVYLDLCAIQRPLDTYSNTRIALEAEAVLGILELCDTERLALVSSEVLEYESEQSILAVRQEHTRAVLAKAQTKVMITLPVEQRAEVFVGMGIKPLDALHLASAEAAGVDFFCTCDDRLLRKANHVQGLKVRVMSPIDLVQELEK